MKKLVFITTLFALINLNTKAQLDTLLSFNATKGANPQCTLISDGTYLYGTTRAGGANGNGTVFKIKPDGTGYVDLLDFTVSNGASPQSSLISDGTYLYGTTYNGGANSYGLIFKIKTDGTGYVNLLNFNGTANGSGPLCSLISDGTYLYGMTNSGGANGYGLIFKVKTDGTGFTVLLNFNNTNGAYPYGSLMSDGTYLYGMTYQGGANNYGLVFKIKTDGTGYVDLLDFNTTNGANPSYGSLISDGTYLYGMTSAGGTNSGMGTLFKIKTDGTDYTDLLDFIGTNGADPGASLILQGTYLYGITQIGGASGNGIIFKIKTDGTQYVDLVEFNSVNGASPKGNLYFDGVGFYGTTYSGGKFSNGVIFKYIDPTMGIAKYNETANLQVCPNPFANELTITSSAKTNAVLFDMLGNKINEFVLHNTTQTISVGNLAPGMYYLQVDAQKIKIIRQ